MITPDKLKKYVESVPKRENESWELNCNNVGECINSAKLPDNWVERTLIRIEDDIIDSVKFYPTKINDSNFKGVGVDASLYFKTLYGYKHVYFTQKELEILKETLKTYGYELSIGEKDSYGNQYSNCRIKW